MKNTIPQLKGRYRFKTYKNGKLIKTTEWISNLIVFSENQGLAIIMNRLFGVKTYDLEITTASIGTSDQAPALTDTDLVEPITDNILIAKKTRTALDTILYEFFIADAQLPEDEYKEFGLFAGSQLFARSLIIPTISKSVGEDLTCEYEILCEGLT
jgi:hypothetical protein